MKALCAALGFTGVFLFLTGCDSRVEASAATRAAPPLASIEARAADCAGWPSEVGSAFADAFAGPAVDYIQPVGFARSVPVGRVVSVYVNDVGCDSRPVTTAEFLPNTPAPGVLFIRMPERRGVRATLYAMVEIASSMPGATRTFVLATKPVTVETTGARPGRVA